VENYFNYFTEIEEHFQRRRGGTLLLSTLDWALIETWKDAGVPLVAVLRGIDAAFERFEKRPSQTRKVNSLAYCAQEVLAQAEEMREAAVGVGRESKIETGFDAAEIARFFRSNAQELESAKLPSKPGIPSEVVVREIASALRGMATEIESKSAMSKLEDLERRLSVQEEKLFAVLLAAMEDDEIIYVRAEADRELSPYRSKMPFAQIGQLQKQYVYKKLLEKYGVPRLSLFYM